MPPLPGAPGALADDFNPAKYLGFGKDDPSGKDLSWIGDFSDELAVAIVLRTYEEAVVSLEKGKTVLGKLGKESVALGLFRPKLESRTQELISALLHDLSDPSIRKTGVVATAGWLLRLGPNAADKARETFLEMRGKLVRKRCRAIRFEGDISLWVGELAMVVFTLVKNTCEWYVTAFRDNRMASGASPFRYLRRVGAPRLMLGMTGFVRWSSQQIEVYAEMFRRQVFGVDQDPKVVQESLAVTRAHAAMAGASSPSPRAHSLTRRTAQLKDVGLDFGFLLDSLLRPAGETKRRRSMGDQKRGASLGAMARSSSLGGGK